MITGDNRTARQISASCDATLAMSETGLAQPETGPVRVIQIPGARQFEKSARFQPAHWATPTPLARSHCGGLFLAGGSLSHHASYGLGCYGIYTRVIFALSQSCLGPDLAWIVPVISYK